MFLFIIRSTLRVLFSTKDEFKAIKIQVSLGRQEKQILEAIMTGHKKILKIDLGMKNMYLLCMSTYLRTYFIIRIFPSSVF